MVAFLAEVRAPWFETFTLAHSTLHSVPALISHTTAGIRCCYQIIFANVMSAKMLFPIKVAMTSGASNTKIPVGAFGFNLSYGEVQQIIWT